MKQPDENDKLRAGTLPLDHEEGCEPYDPPLEGEAQAPVPYQLRSLGSILGDALSRAEARMKGSEKPIPLPWASVAEQLGGGLWPGMHVLVGGTGAGKTTLALQAALGAAAEGFPVAYVGLELDETQIALRIAGERASVGWSDLYLGKASSEAIGKATRAAADLEKLPFYVEMGPPGGWPIGSLSRLVEAMREKHPAPKSGSLPMLVVLDFLQIVGDDADERGRPLHRELRERIGAAAYQARDVSRRLDCAVLLVSSAARDKYATLAGDVTDAGLRCDEKGARYIARPDVLVGVGKESGEIEYAADSVTVAIRWPGEVADADRKGKAVIVATPKMRALAPRWTSLRFDGQRFAEHDPGELVTAIKDAEQKAGKGKSGDGRKRDAKNGEGKSKPILGDDA